MITHYSKKKETETTKVSFNGKMETQFSKSSSETRSQEYLVGVFHTAIHSHSPSRLARGKRLRGIWWGWWWGHTSQSQQMPGMQQFSHAVAKYLPVSPGFRTVLKSGLGRGSTELIIWRGVYLNSPLFSVVFPPMWRSAILSCAWID